MSRHLRLAHDCDISTSANDKNLDNNFKLKGKDKWNWCTSLSLPIHVYSACHEEFYIILYVTNQTVKQT